MIMVMSTDVDDQSLYRQIDQLTSQELRGVIKYLVLLNAEAVQNALKYNYQQRQKNEPSAADTSTVEDSFEAEFTSEFDSDYNDEEPPLHKATQRSQSVDDTKQSVMTPDKPTASSISETISPDSTETPQISNSRGGGSSNNNKIRLVILCSTSPSSNQQAIDQDDAMVFCKHIGVSLPYVVLAESQGEKTLELKSISKVQDHYPQFFVSTSKHNHREDTKYVGSLDTMRQYKKDGILTCEQDLFKLITPSQEQAVSHEEEAAAGATKRHLTFQDSKQLAAERGGSHYSGIPEHLQSRRDYQQAPASDLYQHLRNLAGAPASTLKKKPDSDDTEGDDKLPDTATPLEPPAGGHSVLQDKNANREPPALSPPQSAKRAIRARDGTENEMELSTTEPKVLEPLLTQTATPNRKAQVINTAEPPALSPPKTTTKIQRRVHLEETQGLAISTPNAQVVKRYHVQNGKPEPTPGVYEVRKESIPLEPPSVHKNDVPEKETQENQSTGQYVPESPIAMPEQEDQSTTPSATPEIPGFQEQESPRSSPADDQILDILNGVGACYLTYDETENGGQLSIYYSETPMDHAVGVWSSTDITEFKEAQGLGVQEFIGNCAALCQESPANYFKGWSQFIKAAKSMNGTVITLTKFGIPVEFYTYSNNGGDAICEKVPGVQFETAGIDAVACMPKGAAFDYQTLRGRKWSKQAKKLGSVATFNSLVHNTGVSTTKTTAKRTTPISNGGSGDAGVPTSFDVPTNPTDEDKITDGGVVPSETTDGGAAPTTTDGSFAQCSMEEPKEGYPSAMAAPSPAGGACYLVYEPDSSGRLVEQYSHSPVLGAVGRWVPGPGKKIAGFKFKQNHGKKVLIGNCSAGVQGRKNYCSGWNQFVRSARIQNGEVMLWDPQEGAKGLNVDVWLYTNDKRPTHQSKKLERGVSTSVDSILAVSTIPKNSTFFEGISVDMLKWLAAGSNSGASSKFE